LTPSPGDLKLSPSAGGVWLWIHVTPRARHSAVGGVRGDALRVTVTEPPVGGAANEACARQLARALGVRRGAVALDPAARGRRKRVHIEGDSQDLARRLQALAGTD
jgi:uncharacterized protein YggU (UPF0235/DUF167 family)